MLHNRGTILLLARESEPVSESARMFARAGYRVEREPCESEPVLVVRDWRDGRFLGFGPPQLTVDITCVRGERLLEVSERVLGVRRFDLTREGRSVRRALYSRGGERTH